MLNLRGNQIRSDFHGQRIPSLNSGSDFRRRVRWRLHDTQGQGPRRRRKGCTAADQARVSAAAGLDTVASNMHHGGDRVASAAHGAADAVSHGAGYLRDNDVQTMMGDRVDVIRRNPGPALLGAAAFGFLLGRALSRD